uniref:F-box/kelch-repeat protein n=1 Tax=Noccaea caerulescens TaxID=107243 RepID=A0A1J3CRL6_NOCCA
MKGICAIRRCSQLESENKRRKVSSSSSSSGLCSLPDAVAVSCLACVSKFDLLALGMASKRHRSLVVSGELWDLRSEMGCIEPSVVVCLRIFPERNPRWFVLHPVQRRLKALPWNNNVYQAPPDSSSSFVTVGRGVYVIGGLVNGKPTWHVSFFDCYERTVSWMPSMKMARASASANLIDGKIYVFGGLRDSDSDSSNWAEVFDLETKTWDLLLFVSTPKMPLNIQHSVVIDIDGEKKVFAVDKDGQDLSFSPSKSVFSTDGVLESNPGGRDDWCVSKRKVLFCRGSGGRILWAFPGQLCWKELQYQKLRPNLVNYGITKLCLNSAGNIVIFWNAQPQGPESFELWSAEISLDLRKIILSQDFTTYEMWGEFEWFAPVLKPAPHRVEVLFAGSVYS